MPMLRQSTAATISFGPFVSPTDAVTLQTGLVSAIDHASTGIMLSKNGAALAVRHATVTASTYDAYGNYIVTLDTTDTNTVGRLRVQFAAAASCLPVWCDFDVVEEAVYDALYAASAAGPLQSTVAGRTLDVSATGEAGVDWANVGSPTTTVDLSGTTIKTTQKVDVDTIKTNPVVNAGTITFPTGATLASTTNITAGTVTTATNLTNAPTFGDFTAMMKTSLNNATPSVTVSDKTGFSLSAAGVQAIWDALTSAFTTTGSIGKWILDKLDVAVSTRSTYAGGAVASVTAAVTVGTNNDKTGYALTSSYDPAKTAAQAGDAMTLTSGERATTAAAVRDVDNSAPAAGSLGEAVRNADAKAAEIKILIGTPVTDLATDIAAIPTADENADAALDRADAIEVGLTPRQAQRLIAAASAGKLSGGATTTNTIRNAVADSKDRITATVDGNGNRTAITVDLS